MVSRKYKFIQLPTIMVLAMLCASATTVGQEFKVETSIYSGDGQHPVAQNVTLFKDNLVVDLKTDSATPPNILETKIYDSHQKLIVLLDHSRSVRLEISDTRLLQMVDGLRRDISQKKDLQFLVQEVFSESQELTASQIHLSSPTFKYRVVGQRPKDATYLKIHSEFLDMFTWLNASDPSGFPPFARMKLNESIKNVGWIPSSVEIELKPNALVPNGLKMKSTHVLIDGLSKEDTARIATAKNQWLGYTEVNLLKFHGISSTANAENKAGETATAK